MIGRIISIIFGLLCLFVLIYLISGFIGVKPPIAKVEIGGGTYDVKYGSYCWGNFLHFKCVDSSYEFNGNYRVHPGEVLDIDFSRKPKSITTEVIRDDKVIEEAQDLFSIKAPKQKGTYMYLLYASWNKQSSSYYFNIEVK